jgi:hypothetical protein
VPGFIAGLPAAHSQQASGGAPCAKYARAPRSVSIRGRMPGESWRSLCNLRTRRGSAPPLRLTDAANTHFRRSPGGHLPTLAVTARIAYSATALRPLRRGRRASLEGDFMRLANARGHHWPAHGVSPGPNRPRRLYLVSSRWCAVQLRARHAARSSLHGAGWPEGRG